MKYKVGEILRMRTRNGITPKHNRNIDVEILAIEDNKYRLKLLWDLTPTMIAVEEKVIDRGIQRAIVSETKLYKVL